MTPRKNNIFIISAPSGAGKSTLVELLLSQNRDLFFSISHTTRPARPGEMNGVEYFFISEENFRKMIQEEEFFEWAEVHGYYYGTSREMLKKAEGRGSDLILDIDVQGAMKAKQIFPEATSIFILPPSFEVLRERLQRRQKDTEQQIAKRIENARQEIQYCHQYDYIVINRELHAAFEDLSSIIRSQSCRRENLSGEVAAIIQSFGVQEGG
jgi:guanylate kinase